MGPFALVPEGRLAGAKIAVDKPRSEKVLASIDAAIDAVGLKDGMTISFHHHFRNGDYVLNMVVEAIAKKGIKGITLAPSSLNECNDPIIPYIEQGVITAIETSGARGKLGRLLTAGKLAKPVIIRSHGGRARAIETQSYLLAPAQVGAHQTSGETRLTYGHSLICDPWGHKVAMVSDAPGFATARLDAALIAKVRASIPVAAQRRETFS